MAIDTETMTMALSRQITDVKAQAIGLVVETSSQYEQAGQLKLGIAALKKAIKERYRPRIQEADRLHKGLVADERKDLAPVEEADGIVDSKRTTWRREAERLQHELERKLQDEARKAEEERMLIEAAHLEEQGLVREAEALISAPVMAPVVMLTPAAPKVSGLVERKRWTFRITDPTLIPQKYLVPDEKAIGAVVRALGAQHGIAGVEAFQVESTSTYLNRA